eukprot:CAMPEP_0114335658 /NCGR_PEP_ID=MMETSP0101-20121206/5188_1 /TAXON_ID=38822 ORGANISM="Pteridomonas danica, Strain PT" /NCGR_SAMPLE_ID=MMETSP0101 /ASSEMBLY_ACC=CAM_ASM_000211 /LENGTH=467 /DNA_ID=CAMNT_0001467323 /DNA_START=263 /DNA_END=1666 /DNA_ORIENTATION=-
MPIVYTPTVGQACQHWSEIYTGIPRGIYISSEDKGQITRILEQWPQKDKVKAIVFTDGERILGLGDLGVNGMGIPIGKLALYTACAGISPDACLPIHIDVGTNNEKYLSDPFYIGLKQKRDRSLQYDELIDEFINSAKHVFGERVLLQFEDFGNSNAFRLLEKYSKKALCFNDDIQGTASVVLAGLFASSRISGRELKDETFLFLGAGEAGVGIAELLSSAISMESGCSLQEARKHIHLVDSEGLITKSSRGGEDMTKLAKHKQPYAHDIYKSAKDLTEAVDVIKPSVLIGVSAQSGAFNKKVLNKLSEHTPLAPVVFALSNPTSKAECTAAQAYEWTHGNCIFASGSPFDPVELHDCSIRIPGQGNNAYVFPALALAAISVQAKHLTDSDMYVAARALSELVSEERLASGCVYPSLDEIREVSAVVATAVGHNIIKRGDSALPMVPADLKKYIQSTMYDPSKTDLD